MELLLAAHSMLNVLTPLDSTLGTAQIVVTSGGVSSFERSLRGDEGDHITLFPSYRGVQLHLAFGARQN